MAHPSLTKKDNWICNNVKQLLYYFCIALIVLDLFPLRTAADNGEVPVDLQAKLFLSALTYDKNLEERANLLINIGIVFFPDIPQSKQEAENFSKTLGGFKDKKISGRSFNTTLLTYDGNGDLKKKIVDEQINVVFIAGGEKQQVEELLKLTQAEKILSCTSKAEYVTACGVTMAVGLKDNKPKIYLNLSSAKLEGADFNAKFLRVVEIVAEENK